LRGLDPLLGRRVELQGERLAIVADRAMADHPEGVAAVADVERLVGTEPDRLVIVLEGALVLPLGHIDLPAVVEGGARVGRDADRLVIVLDGRSSRRSSDDNARRAREAPLKPGTTAALPAQWLPPAPTPAAGAGAAPGGGV